jgi:REP element-mobilizing transposase RayT
MPRQSRLDAPGILHHVIIRGIERRNIFKDDEDRNDLIERFSLLLPKTRISCYAWAFMPNHAHFLLRTGDIPLSTLMRRLLTGYVVGFNLRHKRYGHLFQNRYKSFVCQEDIYLKELVRYIHLNPLRAKIVSSIAALNTYPYSGHAVLTGANKNNWQDADYVFSFFGKTYRSARKQYLSYMESGINQGRRPELVGGGLVRSLGGWSEFKKSRGRIEGLKGDQRILGQNEFVTGILAQAKEKFERSYELKRKGYDLKAIADRVCEIFAIDCEQLYTGGRQLLVADARGLFCYWAVRELEYSATHVAKKLNRTVAGVVYALRRGELLAKQQGLKLFKEDVI